MKSDSSASREAMLNYRRGRADVDDLIKRMSEASLRVASKAQPATVATESDSDLEDDGPPPAPPVYSGEDKIRSATRLDLVNLLQQEINTLLKKRSEQLGEVRWGTPTDFDTQIAGKLSKLNTLIGKMPASFESWTNEWQLRPQHWGDDTSASASGGRSAPQQGRSTARPISTDDYPGTSVRKYGVKPRKGREGTSSRDNAQRPSPGAHRPPLPTQDYATD